MSDHPTEQVPGEPLVTYKQCPSCWGTGRFVMWPCSKCFGSGKVQDRC